MLCVLTHARCVVRLPSSTHTHARHGTTRQEKGLKLELTPIGAAGLAHTLQSSVGLPAGHIGVDAAEVAASAFAKLDLRGSTTGRKVMRKKTDRRTPTVRATRRDSRSLL